MQGLRFETRPVQMCFAKSNRFDLSGQGAFYTYVNFKLAFQHLTWCNWYHLYYRQFFKCIFCIFRRLPSPVRRPLSAVRIRTLQSPPISPSKPLSMLCTVQLKIKLPPLVSFLARLVLFLARQVSFLSRHFSFLSRITEGFSKGIC